MPAKYLTLLALLVVALSSQAATGLPCVAQLATDPKLRNLYGKASGIHFIEVPREAEVSNSVFSFKVDLNPADPFAFIVTSGTVSRVLFPLQRLRDLDTIRFWNPPYQVYMHRLDSDGNRFSVLIERD